VAGGKLLDHVSGPGDGRAALAKWYRDASVSPKADGTRRGP
jgi:hypothetical protein